MNSDDRVPDNPGKGELHTGPNHSSPYATSRLAPRVELLDLAQEIAHADEMIVGRVASQLQVIAEQVKFLQTQARAILEQAQRDQRLNHVKCAFRRLPGRTYHLYRRPNGDLEFSMLAPQDWGGSPPYRFEGSYQLAPDMSWTAPETTPKPDDVRETISRLIATTANSAGFDPSREK